MINNELLIQPVRPAVEPHRPAPLHRTLRRLPEIASCSLTKGALIDRAKTRPAVMRLKDEDSDDLEDLDDYVDDIVDAAGDDDVAYQDIEENYGDNLIDEQQS